MAKKLEDMTRSELQRLDDKLSAERLAINRDMIDDGRGHETTRETSLKTDPLSRRFNNNVDRLSAVVEERRRRMRHHGSLDRIKAGRLE